MVAEPAAFCRGTGTLIGAGLGSSRVSRFDAGNIIAFGTPPAPQAQPSEDAKLNPASGSVGASKGSHGCSPVVGLFWREKPSLLFGLIHVAVSMLAPAC